MPYKSKQEKADYMKSYMRKRRQKPLKKPAKQEPTNNRCEYCHKQITEDMSPVRHEQLTFCNLICFQRYYSQGSNKGLTKQP